MLRVVRRTAWVLVAVAGAFAFALGLGWIRAETLGLGASRPVVARAGLPAMGGAFTLRNQRGQRVTEQSFRGKAAAFFFGFTHCPDVCPTTLADMSQHLADLGPDGERLSVVFVTVDPERDTAERLKSYVSSFDPRITALTGTPEEVAAAAKAFGITYAKVPTGGGTDYTMNHTASVILHDAEGRLVGLIDYHENGKAALAKLRRAVRA